MWVGNLKEGVQHGQRSWNGENYDDEANCVYKTELVFQIKGLILDDAERECVLKPASSNSEWSSVLLYGSGGKITLRVGGRKKPLCGMNLESKPPTFPKSN